MNTGSGVIRKNKRAKKPPEDMIFISGRKMNVPLTRTVNARFLPAVLRRRSLISRNVSAHGEAGLRATWKMDRRYDVTVTVRSLFTLTPTTHYHLYHRRIVIRLYIYIYLLHIYTKILEY